MHTVEEGIICSTGLTVELRLIAETREVRDDELQQRARAFPALFDTREEGSVELLEDAELRRRRMRPPARPARPRSTRRLAASTSASPCLETIA